jgi:hypothetical protein
MSAHLVLTDQLRATMARIRACKTELGCQIETFVRTALEEFINGNELDKLVRQGLTSHNLIGIRELATNLAVPVSVIQGWLDDQSEELDLELLGLRAWIEADNDVGDPQIVLRWDFD